MLSGIKFTLSVLVAVFQTTVYSKDKFSSMNKGWGILVAFDEDMVARIRMGLVALGREAEERKMFGGLCFMVKGHMTVGVSGEGLGNGEGSELMVRCGEARAAAALSNPHARLCDFTGRIMKSILLIRPEGFQTDDQLTDWLALALDFIDTEPPKKKTASQKRHASVAKPAESKDCR